MGNGWTTYGKQQMFAIALTAEVTPTLELSLYTASADPNGLPAPVELSTPGYARQAIALSLAGPDAVELAFDIEIGPVTSTSFTGVAIGDPDGIWFFTDDGGTTAVASGHTINFDAGSLLINRTS